MRTTRILKLISAAVATLTVAVATTLFALQGQTNAVAESPVASAPTDSTTPAVPPPTTVPPTTVPQTTVPPTTVPPTTTPPAADPPTPTPTPTPPPPEDETEGTAGTLRPGDKGAGVRDLQSRLRSLGYWLGTPDGTYGGLTVQAVMAFQKVEGLERDGIAGAGTIAALDQATRPQAASGGDVIEVDKARQVLFVVRGGAVEWILNVSTGTEEPYWVNGRSEMADTPVGEWRVAWTHDGVDVGDLGSLYRPRYFHQDGIAVHGAADVPAYPASHGCVRVTNAAMDWIWAENLMPLGSSVWVY